MNDIPTDYLAGYEKARAVDPERAALYVKHTVIGDPLGEAVADDLAALDQEEARRFTEIGMSGDPDGALDAAPATVRAFSGTRKTSRNGSTTRRSVPASACSTGTRTWCWWRSWRAS